MVFVWIVFVLVPQRTWYSPFLLGGIRVVFGWYSLVFAFLGHGCAHDLCWLAEHKIANAPTKAWTGETRVNTGRRRKAIARSCIRGPGGPEYNIKGGARAHARAFTKTQYVLREFYLGACAHVGVRACPMDDDQHDL